MKQRSISLCLLALAAFFCPSCAYMQSHKNVEEMGAQYVGSELKTDNIELYSRAGQWYVGAPKVLLERRHPLIYDSVYMNRDNEPTETVVEGSDTGSKLYLPISAGTAQILQRPDGYSELKVLVDESVQSGQGVLDTLPGAVKHPVSAQLDGKKQAVFIRNREPGKPGAGVVFLSRLDKYTVDVAGTVLYNVAIPVMAPFRFFAEFLTED